MIPLIYKRAEPPPSTGHWGGKIIPVPTPETFHGNAEGESCFGTGYLGQQ